MVINEGRVAQIGTPEQLYDEPANDFVMGFLGEVTHLGGRRIRPHDIDVSRSPTRAGCVPGVVTRLLRIGFEVRATLTTETGEEAAVLMTRTHARSVGLEHGATVFLTPAAGAVTVPVVAAG